MSSFKNHFSKQKFYNSGKSVILLAIEMAIEILMLMSINLLHFTNAGNCKLKVTRIDHSDTQYMYQNASFENLEDGVIMVNLTQARFVETHGEIVSKRSKSN